MPFGLDVQAEAAVSLECEFLGLSALLLCYLHKNLSLGVHKSAWEGANYHQKKKKRLEVY